MSDKRFDKGAKLIEIPTGEECVVIDNDISILVQYDCGQRVNWSKSYIRKNFKVKP